MGGRRYNWKERLFFAVAWTPKATVQASLSAVPLLLIDTYMAGQPDYAQWQQWGSDILATGIFAIIVCASVGTLLVYWTAPVLLERGAVSHGSKQPGSGACVVGREACMRQRTAELGGCGVLPPHTAAAAACCTAGLCSGGALDRTRLAHGAHAPRLAAAAEAGLARLWHDRRVSKRAALPALRHSRLHALLGSISAARARPAPAPPHLSARTPVQGSHMRAGAPACARSHRPSGAQLPADSASLVKDLVEGKDHTLINAYFDSIEQLVALVRDGRGQQARDEGLCDRVSRLQEVRGGGSQGAGAA